MDISVLERDARRIEAELAVSVGRVARVLADHAETPETLGPLLQEATRTAQRLELLRLQFSHPLVMAQAGASAEIGPRENQQRMERQIYMRGLAHRRALWLRASEAMADLRAGRRVPLYPAFRPEDTALRERYRAMDAAFMAMHRLANPTDQNASAEDHGCFSDIPLPPSDFAAHVHAASRVAIAQRRPRPLRFLDVGCGGGIKVLMAAEFFEVSHGLEYDPGYALNAEQTLARAGTPGCHAFEGDGLTFDGYGSYDVIYFFRPMRDDAGMRALEARIVTEAREGTLLIAPYREFDPANQPRPVARIAGAVHVVGADEAAAEALHDAAERSGVGIYDSRRPVSPDTGYLGPLLAALWARGFPV